MTKDEWVKLAEASAREHGWFRELYEAKISIARKHGGETDFIGNDFFCGPLRDVTDKILGEDFCYWLYECDGSFAVFNTSVYLDGNKHPNITSLEDLYDFANGEEETQ